MKKCLLSSAALVGLLSAPAAAILGGVAISALLERPAFAADLRVPVKAAPGPMVAAYSWSGCYLGAQGGYQWGRDHEVITVDASGALFDENRFDSSGVVGGGHVGCNWQSGAWVFGVEADIEGSGVRGEFRYGNGDGTDFRSKVQGSGRLRLGWAVNQTLFYATGGLAWAQLEYVLIEAATAERESRKFTDVGWTVGGGIEQALSANWSVRAEYRYSDYGKVKQNSLVAFSGFTWERSPEFHAVRGYVTYRFGGPVAARY